MTSPRPRDDRTICYFDGACSGNQFGAKGPMRAAYVIGREAFVRDVPDLATPEGPRRSNNIAEYHGLLFLLRELRDRQPRGQRPRAYRICGDSQLVIRQMEGRYRVKEPNLARLHREAKDLVAGLDVEFQWVRREENEAGHLLE